jgi:hypothetical protein
MDPISIRYRMTAPEFMTACDAHWSANGQGSRSNVITGIIGLILGLALLSILFWLALLLVAVGAILLAITWVRSLIWRRAFRAAKKYNADISVVIKDDCVHVENAEGKSDLNWSFFTWYRDTPDHVLLYMTKRSFSVIPKSAFPDQQRVQTFVDLVKSKLEKAR